MKKPTFKKFFGSLPDLRLEITTEKPIVLEFSKEFGSFYFSFAPRPLQNLMAKEYKQSLRNVDLKNREFLTGKHLIQNRLFMLYFELDNKCT